MIAVFRQHRFRVAFVWLALAAVLLRGVLPSGYMPVHAGQESAGIRIALCSGGALHLDGHHLGGHQTEQNECPFALSAMVAIPLAIAFLPDGKGRAPETVNDSTHPILHAADRVRPPARAPPVYS